MNHPHFQCVAHSWTRDSKADHNVSCSECGYEPGLMTAVQDRDDLRREREALAKRELRICLRARALLDLVAKAGLEDAGGLGGQLGRAAANLERELEVRRREEGKR